jgi:hypothetical protein
VKLTKAQVEALQVLDNRDGGDQWVRTWSGSSTPRGPLALQDRVNFIACESLRGLGLVDVTLNEQWAYQAKITAAGCAALAEADR